MCAINAYLRKLPSTKTKGTARLTGDPVLANLSMRKMEPKYQSRGDLMFQNSEFQGFRLTLRNTLLKYIKTWGLVRVFKKTKVMEDKCKGLHLRNSPSHGINRQ